MKVGEENYGGRPRVSNEISDHAEEGTGIDEMGCCEAINGSILFCRINASRRRIYVVILMIAFPVLIFLYFYKTNPGFFREKRKKIQDVYMEEFIEPMLRDWYPDVTVEEKEKITFETVTKFLPSSQEYEQKYSNTIS